MTGVNPS